ncbi:Acidic mammalian chitinase [Nymphon striatum]|nr:Acidic mammalian chitinase [Nymphon striatum]
MACSSNREALHSQWDGKKPLYFQGLHCKTLIKQGIGAIWRIVKYYFGKPFMPSSINNMGEKIMEWGKSATCVNIFRRYLIVLNSLKKYNPSLKIILSLANGGHDLGYSSIVSSDANRREFINNAITYLRKYRFDGIDFDWEFPIIRSRRLLDLEPFMEIYYDIPSMSQSLDYINVMCYDYHLYRAILPFTGHNSPLFAADVEKGGYFEVFNIAWSANAWHQRGAPKEKIIIGLPTYAHTFKLLNPSINGLFAPAIGTALGSDEINYSVVCKFLKSAVLKMDAEAGVPYAYNGTDWISYDDETSIRKKSVWIKTNGFGGAMTWSLVGDDWEGVCGKGNFLFILSYTILFEMLIE